MKQRILFITPLPPPVHGSAMVSQQIKDSEIINNVFDCDFVNLSTSRKMDEIQKFSVIKIFRLLGIYFNVFFHLLFHHYDLCYCAIACFGSPFLKDAPIVLLCKLFGRKVLIHQHNKGMSRYCRKPIYKQLYHWVYRHTRVMLLSWRLYDDISEIVKKEQVCICPNGITPIESLSFEKKSISETKICRLLYLSNLIPTKGCNVLLDALSILKERGYDFVCDFVGGDCPEQSAEHFESLIEKKGLNDCTFYRGRKYGKDKDEYYRNADVFVFPTFYFAECFPLVLLEAMQYGLPCISTREAAIPDIIKNGENGLLVDYCSDNNLFGEKIADAIQWMIDHPKERLNMGAYGKSLFERKYTKRKFETTLALRIKNAVRSMGLDKLNSTTLGYYLPSFFELFIESSCVNFENGQIKRISVFTHEYIHYLQDLMTQYGLNGIYCHSEYLHSVVNRIRNTKEDHFDVPCCFVDNDDNVLLNQYVYDLLLGFCDKNIKNLFISAIKIQKEDIAIIIPDSPVKEIECVELKCAGVKDCLTFGSFAIMESMAYIIERNATRDSVSSPDWPYNAAEYVARKISPAFASDIMNVLALCDMSLMTSNSGLSFVDFLQNVKLGKIVISKPEDVYDFFYKSLDWKQIKEHYEWCRKCLKSYIRLDGYFDEYNKTVDTLIDKAWSYRMNEPYIFLKLARSCQNDGVNPVLKQLVEEFSSPLMRNESDDYYTLTNKSEFFEYMRAIKEINNLLENGNAKCNMIGWCKKTKDPNIRTDARCMDRPWEHCKDTYLCPYALLWKHWGLSGMTPITHTHNF